MDIGIELGNIAHALKALKEAKVIRTKNLVGDLGEYYCSQIFNIQLNDTTVEKGFDGYDEHNKRVEIKTGREPANRSKIIFRGFEFDYCLYVELNEFFEPCKILKIDVEEIKQNLEAKKDRLSVGKLKHRLQSQNIL